MQNSTEFPRVGFVTTELPRVGGFITTDLPRVGGW